MTAAPAPGAHRYRDTSPYPEPEPEVAEHVYRHKLMVRAGLNDREIDTLAGIAEGRTNREIAATLGVSEDTVKTAARSLFGKLDAKGRANAVLLACRNGWIA